jgi:hypothetical protein
MRDGNRGCRVCRSLHIFLITFKSMASRRSKRSHRSKSSRKGSGCTRGKKLVRSRSVHGKSFTVCRTSRPSSKGWKRKYPHKGAERHLLYKHCGSKCFGVPRKQLFPICSAHRSRSGRVSCKISPIGTSAAYNRARQLKRKYPGLAVKIRSLAKRHGFAWTHE